MQRVVSEPHHPIYYQFDCWHHAPLRHGVFTRHGGVSKGPFDTLNVGGMLGDSQANVLENSRRIYHTLGLHPRQVCTVWQVHGADTVFVNGPQPQRKWLARADGMVTQRTDIGLAMRYADCVPVLFYDQVQHALGLAHAGWRGTVAGVVCAVVAAMQTAFGSVAADIQAAIGPSIGPEHYQVGEEVVAAVQSRFGSTEGLIARAADGSAYLNLWAANRRLLESVGVQHIEVAGICTAQRTDDFYSHRAEKGKTGRFGAVMALNEL